MKLFVGPGNKLILSTIKNYAGFSFSGTYERFEVPFGWWYSGNMHGYKLVRVATKEEMNLAALENLLGICE